MKAKTTKRALFASIFSTLLCGAMLAGSTFAWFTDSATSGNNKIVAGNLDIELYVQNDEGEFVDATDVDGVFGVDLWEPGVVAYETFKAVNVGNLALKYNMYLDVLDKNTVGGKSLADVIKVSVINGELGDDTTRDGLIDAGEWKAISDATAYVNDGVLLPEEEGDVFTVVAYWEPTDHDNDYNLNNGKKADDGSDALYIDFGVTLAATQYTYEADSFDDQYDANAHYGIRAVTGAIAQGAKDSNEALEEATNGLVYFDETLTDEDGVLAITLHFDLGSKGFVLEAFDAISELIVSAVDEQAANIKSIEIGAGLPEKLAALGIEGVETTVRELNGKPIEYTSDEYESWLFEDLATLMKAAGLGGSSLRDAMEACLEFAATEGLDVAITSMDGNTQVYRMYFALNWTESASVKTAVNQGAKDANAILANATNGLIYFDNALQQSGDELVITLHFEEGSFDYVEVTYAAVKALIGEAVYANAANIEYIQIVNQEPRYPADFDPAGDWVEADLRAVMSGISGGLTGALEAAKAEGLAVTIATTDGVVQVYRMNFDINW